MLGSVGAIAELLSKVFGWTVDPNGLGQLTLDNQLKYIARGINEAIANNDMESADALFAQYRELRREQGP